MTKNEWHTETYAVTITGSGAMLNPILFFMFLLQDLLQNNNSAFICQILSVYMKKDPKKDWVKKVLKP